MHDITDHGEHVPESAAQWDITILESLIISERPLTRKENMTGYITDLYPCRVPFLLHLTAPPWPG
ncbi:hypothetical protein DPMN_017546 [Dreissena polymorpha]|uniref:Uncharacterized protein n=1 Tax=Dreissena polymorpha TaxID=45954 RepID=A0A9D4S5J0_DREPO|nr:hypothetical protein DPMN_017546 [Dreissena polymorpha]